MGIATTGSVVGTLFGLICLALFTPLLGEIALSFGAFEFFWLALLGVVTSGNIVATDPLKGWIAGFLGLFVAGIGQEGMYAYERFSFGNADLAGGFQLIPVLVGAFGFSEVLTVMSERFARPKIMEFGSALPRIMDVLKYWRTIIRSGVIGVVGRHPARRRRGHGGVVVLCGRRGGSSKEPEKYGKGSIEGLMAAETGDNASVPGGIIPALALAIPGSAPCAVLLAAMIIHGVQAGPMLMVEQPQFVYDVVAMVLFSTIGILFFGLFFIKPLLKITQIPRSIMMPIIFVLCVIGSYSLSSRLFDVYTMLGFGVLVFIMRQLRLPGRALRARPRARRHPGQEPAARPGAERRRPPAVLHPPDQRDPRGAGGLDVRDQCEDHQRRDGARPQRATGQGLAESARKLMRVSLCNEVIGELPFARQCALAAELGYDGLEVAPMTLGEDPTRLTGSEIAALRRAASDAGIAITGLHYLMRAPAGLSITSADDAQRDAASRSCGASAASAPNSAARS